MTVGKSTRERRSGEVSRAPAIRAAVFDGETSTHDETSSAAGVGRGHQFGEVRVLVGAPDNAHEREAQQIAGQIDEAPTARLAAKAASGAPSGNGTLATPSAVATTRTAGQPLDAATRAYMEPRFGQDFSHIRIHADDAAAAAARSINARAYTLGSHVVFDRSFYAPHSSDGRRLLAHELTHVVQQTAGTAASPDSVPGDGVLQRDQNTPGMTSNQGASAVAPGTQASVPSPEQTAGRARIDKALNGFSQGTFKDIQESDWPLATPDERIRLIEKATDPSLFWVGPLDELAIEACWRSFGEGLRAAVEAHPVVWARSVDCGADPENIPASRGKLQAFKSLTIEEAGKNLDRNEDAIISEMKGWGLTPPKHLLSDPSKGGDAQAAPDGQLAPDVVKRLEEQRKLARVVVRHERNLKELRTRRVGKYAEPFVPGRPPGEDWAFGGKTTYEWVNESWDKITGEISLILNAYPALYAAHGRDELDKFAFSQPTMQKGGEFYFPGTTEIGETKKQLEQSLEGIKKTRQTLGDNDAYLDLTPVHRSLYSGRVLSAAGQSFSRAMMQPIVFDEKTVKDDAAAAVRFGIDAALFVLIVAGTIGTMGGAAIAVGVAAGRALQAQNRADELSAAHGAAVSDDSTLVTKSAVTAAEAEAEAARIEVVMTAVMEAQGVAIHAVSQGANTAAKAAEQKLAGASSAEGGGEMSGLRKKLRGQGEPGDPAAPRSSPDPNATVPIAGQQLKSWEGVPLHQRPTELGKVANQRLVASGVPPVDIVISPGRGCAFDYKSWTIKVPERYFSDAITHTDFLDMYASAMHEAEHAMDWFNVARFRAPNHTNAADLANALGFRGPRAMEAAEHAFQSPMSATDPLRARAMQVYESVYGNPAPRNAIYAEKDAAEAEYEAKFKEWSAKADARTNLPDTATPVEKARADYEVAIADEARDKAHTRYRDADAKYRALPEEQLAYSADAARRDWAGAGLRALEIERAQKRVDYWRNRLAKARNERAQYQQINASREALDEAEAQIATSQEKFNKARSDLAAILAR